MAGRDVNSTDEQALDKWTLLYMSDFAFFLINRPLLILNLMANIFFGFCLMTRKTQQVKQPLTMVLGLIVGGSSSGGRACWLVTTRLQVSLSVTEQGT